MQEFFSSPFDRATRVEVSSSFRINNLVNNFRSLNGTAMTCMVSGTNAVEITCYTYRMVKSPDKPAVKSVSNAMTYVIRLNHLTSEQREILGLHSGV